MQPQSGLLLADKPVGPSSFALVRALRRKHGAKAGHAGTLDPLASGLLLVLLGPATRLIRYLVGLDKRYVTEIELGRRTTTGDREGQELERTDPPDLPAALSGLVGEVALRIPAASAVRIGGKRAYRLHRRGIAVDMPIRRSTVHELRLLAHDEPRITLELHVGSGTYVRAIADALGGHCVSLRRTAVGPFGVEDADEERVLPPVAALPFLQAIVLSDEENGWVRNGRPIERAGAGLACLVHGGELVAVARLGAGLARPETVILGRAEND